MGDTTLCLLLHANGLNRRVWAPVVEDLAALWGLPFEMCAAPRAEASLTRVGARLWLASLDLLGHGAAPELHLAGAETDWMQFPRQVEAFLDECLASLPEVPREIVAVGHSLGGGVLLMTQAFAEPKRFSRMLIFEPMWLFVQPQLWPLINLPPLPPGTERLENPMVAQTLRRRSEWPTRAAAREDLSKKDFFAVWDKRVFQAYLDGGLIGNEPCRLACAPRTEATVFLTGVPVSLLEALRRPDGLGHCELHVSIGTKTIWTVAAANTLFGALSPAPVVEVEPGGHMWPMERPKDFAKKAARVLSTRSRI